MPTPRSQARVRRGPLSSRRSLPLAVPSRQVTALVDSVRDYAIFMLAPDGIVLTWNAGAEAIKGYAADEIIGQHFSRFYTPEDRAAGRPEDLLREALAEGRVEDEGWRVRKDGTRFWAVVVITPIRDSAGRLEGFVKVTRDLTARRDAEERVRRGEQRIRLLIESIRDYAVFMMDPEGRIETWNRGAEQIKGYRADEVIGQPISIFYTPEDRAAGRARALLATAAAERVAEDEGWRVRKDGTRFWADAVISRIDDDDGRLLGFVKVTRDLTERRRAEQELAARAAQQAAIAELGVLALRIHDVDAVIARAIETIRELLAIHDVTVATTAPAVAGVIAIPLGGDGDDARVLVVGSEPDRELTATDISFLQAVGNVVATALDRRRSDEQVRATEAHIVEERARVRDAERAVRERDDFISIAAHELRTPLAALRLKLDGIELLVRREPPPPLTAIDDRVAGAIRHADRMSALIDRLLDVSRIVAGRLELERTDVDLGRMVAELADGFREQALDSGCELHLDVTGDAVGVWDHARIEQVVINLLSNALKYGAGRPIELEVRGAGDRVRLTVCDHGIGIGPKDVERIFGRFERAVPVTHYAGLGLGLYVSRYIVEAHGGTIAVASKTGQGACFAVDLPRRGG